MVCAGYTAGFTAEQFNDFMSGSYWKGVSPAVIYPDCFTHFLWLPQSEKGPVLKGEGSANVIERRGDKEKHFNVHSVFKAEKKKFTDGLRKYTLSIHIKKEFEGDMKGKEETEIFSGIYSPHELLDKHLYDSLSEGAKESSFFHIIERKGMKFKEKTKIMGVTDEMLGKEALEVIAKMLGYDERFFDPGIPKNMYFKYVEVKKEGEMPHPLYENVRDSVFVIEKSVGNHPNQRFHKLYITDRPFEIHEIIMGSKERISIMKKFEPVNEKVKEMFKEFTKELHAYAKGLFK